MWLRELIARRRLAASIILIILGVVVVPGGTSPSATVSSCTRSGLDLGGGVRCQATVFGFSPSGPVSWTPSGEGNVSYIPPWCSLSIGTCDVVLNGTAPGQVNSTAAYLGDSKNNLSDAGSQVTVYPPLMPAIVNATPYVIRPGRAVTLFPTSPFFGGTPPFSCQWLQESPNATSFSRLGNAFGCESVTLRPVRTSALKAEGVWLFALMVTDSSDDNAPISAVSAPALVNVTGPSSTHPAIKVYCLPSTVRLGALSNFLGPPSTTCRAIVIGNNPVGTVKWSADSPGKFHGPSCLLLLGTCTVRFVPSASGPLVTITGDYSGDKRNPPLTTTTGISVIESASRTRVLCLPKTIDVNATIRCWAYVKGYQATGDVQWSNSGKGNVSFFSTSCHLYKGVCSVVMNGTQAGSVIVRAEYQGDLQNRRSSSFTRITLVISPRQDAAGD